MADNINPDHYKRLPAEAIEIIEAGIDKAPSNQDAYLHGQVLKYILRCWNKNGIEDLKKAKWYLDRMIERCDLRESLLDISNGLVKAWACENGKAKQVYPEQPQPPDGWRWLEVGEILRRLDASFNSHGTLYELNTEIIGRTATAPNIFIRRNRFEVGEKVVYIPDQSVWTYVSEINDGPNHPKSAHVASGSTSLRACVTKLAPYIEETK